MSLFISLTAKLMAFLSGYALFQMLGWWGLIPATITVAFMIAGDIHACQTWSRIRGN